MMTAKKTLSTLRGQRDIVTGQIVEAKRSANAAAVSKLSNTLSALEYAEASVASFLDAGKSGLKAGVRSGFVPYAER